jgi:hypothetical protein
MGGLDLGELQWQSWWDWGVELSPHVAKRMFDLSCLETHLLVHRYAPEKSAERCRV